MLSERSCPRSPRVPALSSSTAEPPDCVEHLTDGDRSWAGTVMLLFAALLPLPPATKGFNRVVNSLTHWLSDSALNIAENQLSVHAAGPGCWRRWRGVPGERLRPWPALRSPRGFLSLAPLLRLQTRGAFNANCGTFSEVDRCPLGTERSPGPCRPYGSV